MKIGCLGFAVVELGNWEKKRERERINWESGELSTPGWGRGDLRHAKLCSGRAGIMTLE